MKITLCGSARFEEYFKFWNEMLSLYGHTVYTLSVYPSQKEAGKDWYNEEEKITLDQVHLDKIFNSEAILVLNPFAYLGDSTLREVEFAEKHGKQVFFLESWAKGFGIEPGTHYQHVVELSEYFKVPNCFGSPIDTHKYHQVTSPLLLGGASEIRSKIFTCYNLFKLSLYRAADIKVDFSAKPTIFID